MQDHLTCMYCGKDCKSKMSKVRHEYFCKLNPDYGEHLALMRRTTLKAANSKESREKANKSRRDNIQNDENEKYVDYVFKCEKCGKEFIRRLKVRRYKEGRRIPRFCSQKCANGHVHSAETKNKIRHTLINLPETEKVCPKCGQTFMTKATSGRAFCSNCSRQLNHDKYSSINGAETNGKHVRQHIERTIYHEDTCIYCGRKIITNTVPHIPCPDCAIEHHEYPFLVYDPITHKRIVSKVHRKHISESQRKCISEGRHKGWTTRNISSYPERFWKKVLENNGIGFKFNFPVKKSDLGVVNDCSCYFLDFCIDDIVDLEIDGKQHDYPEREASDVIRDDLLSRSKFVIYRIKWNEIKTDEGKEIMRHKIEDFLQWLSDFRRTRTSK